LIDSHPASNNNDSEATDRAVLLASDLPPIAADHSSVIRSSFSWSIITQSLWSG